MDRSFIVGARRTAIRRYGEALREVPLRTLASTAIKAALEHAECTEITLLAPVQTALPEATRTSDGAKVNRTRKLQLNGIIDIGVQGSCVLLSMASFAGC